MKCSNCNATDHEPNARFCHICGNLLNTVSINEITRRKGNTRFEWAESFSEGLAMVTIGGKTGFIDTTGNIVIEPKYEIQGSYSFGIKSFCGFSEGVAVVCVGEYPNRRYGCIDRDGNLKISARYDCIWQFTEGLAPLRMNEKWGFISKNGHVVISPQYEMVSHFCEGLAAVMLDTGQHIFVDKAGNTAIEKTKGVILTWDDGLPIRKARFEHARSFHNGFAAVECAGQKGYIDKNGKFTRTKYDSISDFSEGLACFSVENYTKCGYIDKNLKVVIDPIYENAGDFNDGRAVVCLGGKVGYIDSTGQLVIPCQFDHAAPFNGGLAAVEINKKYGYIDLMGNMVIPPLFESAREFSEGFAAVYADGRWRYIDKNGNFAF